MPSVPPRPGTAPDLVPSDLVFSDPAAVAGWNRTHDMAGLRARGGLVVRSIEARRRRLVADRVRRARPRLVVDVGCEDGWIAEAYAGFVEETVLVDLDPEVLARAARKGLPGARCVVADVMGPAPLKAGIADVVVLSAVLEHVARPDQALAAWAGVVRPGGRLVVYVPADRPILLAKRFLAVTGLHRLVRGLSLAPAPGHVVTFARRSLARLLNLFGCVEEIAFDPLVLGYVATVRTPAAPPSVPRRA